MSLEYYLFCRNNYNEIIMNLENIIEIYDSIIYNTYSELDLDISHFQLFQPENNCDFFIKKLNHISQLKKLCDDKIITLCNHELVDDSIDVDPDRSENITYCKICGFTK